MSEETKVQHLIAKDSMQDELIDFINYVFHMNGKDDDFYRMLPKLYKREYHPCRYNYVTLENNRIVAAVGSFPGEVEIAGTTLSYYGIGNVAVNPYCRSKGYMKQLMNMAVEDMKKKDVDFTLLTGRRNRYSYFSYEVVGRRYQLWLDESNIKHSAEGKSNRSFRFHKVKEEDIELISAIADLHNRQSFHYVRPVDKVFDIMLTWQASIFSIHEGESFAGYFILYENSIKEFYLEHPEQVKKVVADFVTTAYQEEGTFLQENFKEGNPFRQGIIFELPEFQRNYIDDISELAEHVSIHVAENFSVFHYCKVLEPLFRLKASQDMIPDGEVVLLIHGAKSEERLLIKSSNREVSVTTTDRDYDYEFSHKEAMEILFGNYSPSRNKLSLLMQTWFPLPIYIFPADLV